MIATVAIGLAAIACTPSAPEAGEPSDEPTMDAAAVEAEAEWIAIGFVDAFGAFDAERAIAYLADDAAIFDLIAAVGAHDGVDGTRDELPLFISLLRAAGYRQTLEACEAQGASASGTRVRCAFDFHFFGSDRLGLGPYGGSFFDLTVSDGAIVQADASFEVDEFSPQVWEPFATWVSETYPEHVTLMYDDETQGGMRLSEDSVRAWRRHVHEYVDRFGS